MMPGSPAYHQFVNNTTPLSESARAGLQRRARQLAVTARTVLPKEPGDMLGAELEFMSWSTWIGSDQHLARFMAGVELMCQWARNAASEEAA